MPKKFETDIAKKCLRNANLMARVMTFDFSTKNVLCNPNTHFVNSNLNDDKIRNDQVSISKTFYEQLLCEMIPKAQKRLTT